MRHIVTTISPQLSSHQTTTHAAAATATASAPPARLSCPAASPPAGCAVGLELGTDTLPCPKTRMLLLPLIVFPLPLFPFPLPLPLFPFPLPLLPVPQLPLHVPAAV